MKTGTKIIIISLVFMATFQIITKSADAKEYKVEPIIIEPWMPIGWLKKNYKLCSGKYYKKYIKCEWVKNRRRRK